MSLEYGFFHVYNYSPCTFHIGNTGIDPIYPSHLHSHIEIIRVVHGKGKCKCDEREYDISEDDIMVFNSYTIHSIYSDETMIFHCFIIDSIFCSDHGIPVSDINFTEYIRSGALNEIFDDAVVQLKKYKASPCHETRVKIALLNLLVALREDHTDSLCSKLNTLTPALYQTKKAMQYIMTNRQKRITVNDIVEYVNVSSAHLSRNFKQITGRTLVEFINITKCDMAQSLLASGLAVTEVANMCGFDPPSYFAKTFKKYTGTSPKSHTMHGKSSLK